MKDKYSTCQQNPLFKDLPCKYPPSAIHLHAMTTYPPVQWRIEVSVVWLPVPSNTRILLVRKQRRMDVGSATCSPYTATKRAGELNH